MKRTLKTARALWLALALLMLPFAACAEDAAALSLEALVETYCLDAFEALYFDVLLQTEAPDSPGFAVQPKAAQALHIFMNLDMEIQCGGIAQFFYNNESTYAARVPEALRELGLDDVAQLYEGFLGEYGITMAEIDSYRARFPLAEQFGKLYGLHPFSEFDDAYMEIWYQTNLNRRVLDYAQAHPEALPGR